MATLQISVWDDAVEVVLGPVIQEEIVTITGTSAQSNVIVGTAQTRRVRLYSDADCFVTWGANPTALADGTAGRMMGANNPEYFELNAGVKVAVIERV